MLNSINLNDKDYQQLLTEAVAQIPLYSQEWTNMNASEPGITILENLSAFSALQQSEMNEVPEKIKWKLLALAGFKPQKGITAKAYLEQTDVLNLQASYGEKVYAQNICYELPEQSQFVQAPIVGAYTVIDGETKNLQELTKNFGIPGGVPIFGKHPMGGEMLYLLLQDLPKPSQEAVLYVEVNQLFERNALRKEDPNPFAEIQWEILTKEGFVAVKAEDETHQFLTSGYIHLEINTVKEKLRLYENNYVIRAKLTNAQYDIIPYIKQIQGLLTKLEQRDTLSVIMQGNALEGFQCNHYLLQEGIIEVFVKEKDGKYYQYQEDVENTKALRTFQIINEGEKQKKIVINQVYVDTNIENNIFVLCRDQSVMPYNSLGTLYGYDNQIIELPPMKQVMSGQFSILVMSKNHQGLNQDLVGHIVYPNSHEEGDVIYNLSENDNTLTIKDCGMYEGAQIYLGDYVLYQGSEGNVLPNTLFHLYNKDITYTFKSCAEGEKGRFQESFEDVRKRFALDIQKPVTIVTHQDCENLIAEIPGLSIHKMKAIVSKGQNEIHVVIKPNSLDKFPKLSDIYCNVVKNYLDKRRMLSTKIVIEQPHYVPIDVQARIYVKKHYDHCHDTIERLIRQLLDGFAIGRNFGETILFHDIYHQIEMLECVDEIYDLSIISGDLSASKICGLDIQLSQNALFCPGNIVIELTTK